MATCKSNGDMQRPAGYLHKTQPLLTDMGLAALFFASQADLQQHAEDLGKQLLTLILSSDVQAVHAHVHSCMQGPPGYLQETLPVLTVLGLAANLVASWANLQQLAEELGEQLLTLTLSNQPTNH